MASIENSLKYEAEVEPGKVRLITSDMGGSRSVATMRYADAMERVPPVRDVGRKDATGRVPPGSAMGGSRSVATEDSISNGAEMPSLPDGRPECVGSRPGAASRKVNPIHGRAVSPLTAATAETAASPYRRKRRPDREYGGDSVTVNDMKARGCSGVTGGPRSVAAETVASPHPPASEEGRPERVPCAGNGNGTSLNNAGSNGNYWSSVPNSDNNNNAWNLNFNSSNHDTNNNNRNNGQSVRPVQVFTAGPQGGVPHRGLQLLADLIVAYRDARRHKRSKFYQRHFEMNQERELVKLRDELLERRYVARPSSCFIIHDPKMREVFAAEFRDRVVHHLFYNYTHKLFERTFIADCYSCIEGRGTHYGVDRLRRHILSCSQNWTKPCYVLKLDVKGYFMSINRARLLARCRELLGRARRVGGRGATALPGGGLVGTAPRAVRELDWDLVDYLLESICMLNPVENCRVRGNRDEWKRLPRDKSLFHSRSGCGLPIGNLSSQLFSNIYLGVLDDFMKRELKCRHYGRYVDDAFVVASSKEEPYGIVPRVREFLRDELELELNEDKVRVADAYRGMEFLGAFIKPYRTYPATRTLRRMCGRLKSLDWSERPGRIQARVNSMLGVLSHYDCWHMRKVLVHQGRLHEFGEVTDDCCRFYPDALALQRFQTNKCGGEK